MAVTHARVCYVDDKVVKTVLVKAIKNYNPKNDTDFDKKKIYQVEWADKNTKNGYYKANILLLGTSSNDINDKIKVRGTRSSKADQHEIINPTTPGKKKATPRLKKGVLRTNSNDKKQQRMQQKAENELAVKILHDKISSVMKSQDLQKLPTEDSSSEAAGTKDTNEQYDRPLPSTSTAESRVEKNRDLELKLLKIEQERERLVKELAFYRENNSNDYQEEIYKEASLNNADNDKHPVSPISSNTLEEIQDEKSKTNKIEDEDSSQSEDEKYPQLKDEDKEEMHYLGEKIYVPKDTWEIIEAKEPKKFIRDLAEVVWPRRQLQNRCFDLTKAANLENRSPRKQFSPKKVRIIKEAYRARLAKTGLSGNNLTQVTNGFKRIISEKVNDLNKNVEKIKHS